MATITIGPTNGVIQKFDVAFIAAASLTLDATNFPWYTAANVAAVYAKSSNRQGYSSSKPGGALTSLPQLLAVTTGMLPNVYELNLKAQITLDTAQFYVLGGVAAAKLDIPANLQATNTSASSISVAASAVANAVGYQFQLATNSGFTSGLVSSPTQTNPAYAFTGLAATTAYFLRAAAIGNGTTYSSSAYSSAIQVTTPSVGGGTGMLATDDGANAATFALPSGEVATDYAYEILP